MLKIKISSQKCDYFRNIRRFLGMLFAYIEINDYLCGEIKNEMAISEIAITNLYTYDILRGEAPIKRY